MKKFRADVDPAGQFLGTNFACLTSGTPGISGVIKARPSDFIVEEIPLYEPSGSGTHLYFELEKTGVSTPGAVKIVASTLGIKGSDIGVAGNKDSLARTVQRMSVEHIEAGDLDKIDHPDLNIRPLGFHKNKLRSGHLEANRFKIKIRDSNPDSKKLASETLKILTKKGVPNYYGCQRFGRRGDSGLLGETLVKNRLKEFVRLYLGNPMDNDPPAVRKARTVFDQGEPERAFEYWPRNYNAKRNALAAYVQTGRPGPVLSAVPRRMRRLFVSAFQSYIFNQILSRRLPEIDKLFTGDIAKKEDSGGIFHVEEPSAEQPRADKFEISPTGPMFGTKCWMAKGKPGQIEKAEFARFDINPKKLKKVGSLRLKGSRRSLRFEIKSPDLKSGSDAHGEFLEVSFTLPTGCYATVLLREIIKSGHT
jgi:tRNA pseudouridine13 synthase